MTPLFVRGDVDGSGTVSGVVDALFLLNFGFSDGVEPPCLLAADADSSGNVTALVDGLYILNFFFTAGPPPGPPFPVCGEDPTFPPPLSCSAAPLCP